ncbi:MAG: hypothetical protein HGB23_06150 [Chlorobiaceae bacterium]|nr:hypothetical protein [Chlorobiaceae bacterium]
MQVVKWGNSLAVKFSARIVKAFDLKEGEEIDLQPTATKAFTISKKKPEKELLLRLHQFRGRLPVDFHFDREQAHERDDIQ